MLDNITIIVVGATQEEHDICLEKVVQKLNEHGLTLNVTKCQINVPELTYMGYAFMSQGLQVSDEKVKAIVNAPLPKDRSEVRSFLVLAQFFCEIYSKCCIHHKSILVSN